MRVFDYRCSNGHINEVFVNDINQHVPCSTCGATTERLVSIPSVKLEGITGAFPGAYLKWENKRKEKMAQERKRETWHQVPR